MCVCVCVCACEVRRGVPPSPSPTKEAPPNVSYHLSKVAPTSHQNQVYKSFGTSKKHQKITNRGSKIASARPRGASGASRASQERDLLQQVALVDIQNGAKRRQDGARRAPRGALEAHLGVLFRLLERLRGVLGALFRVILLRIAFFINFLSICRRFWDGFWYQKTKKNQWEN